MAEALETPTLIISGSAAGMGVARSLQERGLRATIIESEPEVGIRWRTAYDRLHLHTPRSTSGLPYEPMPASYPRYPSRQQVADYLSHYAAKLTQPILFNRRAVSVRRGDDRWITETAEGAIVSASVVIATGNARVPSIPSFSGIERFAGPVLHTSLYRNGEPYRGQRVLVVGFGNSAAEIAIDLCEHGAQPTLSVRGPVNVLPRDLFGIPIVSFGLIQKLFGPRVADRVTAPIIRLALGDIRRLGFVRPAYGPNTEIRQHHQIPVLDVGTIGLIRAGRIGLRPGIRQFTQAGAIFSDGRQERFGAVILGTGYRASLGKLLANVPGVLDGDGTPLLSGRPTAAPGLYFCGFEVAAGGQFRQIGLEAARLTGLIADA